MPMAKVHYLCTHGVAEYQQKGGCIGEKVAAPVKGKTKCSKCGEVKQNKRQR